MASSVAPALSSPTPHPVVPASAPKPHLRLSLLTSGRRAQLLLLSTALLDPRPAASLEFGFTAPDQTVEEAEAGIRIHGRALVGIGPLVESGSWREAQLELRESSAGLKQDLYTIIQSRPPSIRPNLRRLYSVLFNNVTRLDYAARGKDAKLAEEYYQNIVSTLNDILAKI